jgi:hypothetical protein
MSVGDGTYRIIPASSFEFEYEMKTDVLPKGTFKKEGSMLTAVSGVAKATQNSTHLILENEILEIVLQRIGNETKFDGINTSSIIKTIKIKESSVSIIPNDTAVKIGNITNTSWGLGYSKLTFEGNFLSRAEAIAHIRSNLTNLEYDVFYTLPASSDFLIISIRNVSAENKTTINFAYRLGSSANDTIRIAGNETVYNASYPLPTCYASSQLKEIYACSYDKIEFSQPHTAAIIYSGSRTLFEKICNDRHFDDIYKFNLSAQGPLQIVLTTTKGVCTDIGNKTAVVETQGVPSAPFASYALAGPTVLQISLQYEKILLQGDLRIGKGTHNVCVRNVGETGNRAVVNITLC